MDELSLTRFKRCTKCGCTKPATREFFSEQARGALGFRAACKRCYCAHVKRLYQANRNEMVAKAKAYRDANPRRIKAARSRAYWKDIEKSREYLRRKARERYEKNPDAVQAANRAWREANKEWTRLSKLDYKARRRGAEGKHTFEEVWQMYEDQDGLCAYCETPLFGSFHVDHMLPISRGGSNGWENLAVTCDRCNLRKHTKTAEEFMMVLRE